MKLLHCIIVLYCAIIIQMLCKKEESIVNEHQVLAHSMAKVKEIIKSFTQIKSQTGMLEMKLNALRNSSRVMINKESTNRAEAKNKLNNTSRMNIEHTLSDLYILQNDIEHDIKVFQNYINFKRSHKHLKKTKKSDEHSLFLYKGISLIMFAILTAALFGVVYILCNTLKSDDRPVPQPIPD